MKRKLRNVLFLNSLIFFVSCDIIKEKQTDYIATAVNHSGAKLEIIPFQYGLPAPDLRIELKNGDSMVIGNGFDRGIANHGGFYSSYFSIADSLHVVFNDSFLIAHYGEIPEPKSVHFYPYDSQRNLFNYLSFEYWHIDKSKYFRRAFYRYVFVEQDYLDAKN